MNAILIMGLGHWKWSSHSRSWGLMAMDLTQTANETFVCEIGHFIQPWTVLVAASKALSTDIPKSA